MIRTRRWESLALAALLVAALGVFFQSQLLVSLAVIPVTFVAYGALTREPPLSVDVERELSPASPIPGDDVTVVLTVTNTGESTIGDLRVIDGVPADIGVIEGSPRGGMLLRPGTSEAIEYTVTARRGTHEFEPVTLLAYTASGTTARRSEVTVETTLECQRPIEELSLGDQTSSLIGPIPTKEAGSGVEFYAVREYHPSDARNQIDWRRFARTGELTSVEYRKDRAASVALLVDARPVSARSAATPSEPPAIEYSAYAAELYYHALAAESHRVGIGVYPFDVTALGIGAGPQHEIEARTLFEEHEAFDVEQSSESWLSASTDGGGLSSRAALLGPAVDDAPATNEAVTTLLSALPAYTQFIVFSPLLDDEMGGVVNTVRAHGHDVMVVSPDVTAPAGVGGRVAAHKRQIRIRTLRESNVEVVDWNPEEPLSSVLRRVL